MADALFDWIDAYEPDPVPALDAGAGAHSLRWLVGRSPRVTGVTATEREATRLREALHGVLRDDDELVAGDWRDEALLAGRTWPLVVADYLLGAVEGPAPYFQEEALARVGRHLAPDGRLYVVGLEPFAPPATPGQVLIDRLHRLRDAAILVAGGRPYREYPRVWVEANLARHGLSVTDRVAFTNIYDRRYLARQAAVVRHWAGKLAEGNLALGLISELVAIEHEADASDEVRDGVRYSEDWIVRARRRVGRAHGRAHDRRGASG